MYRKGDIVKWENKSVISCDFARNQSFCIVTSDNEEYEIFIDEDEYELLVDIKSAFISSNNDLIIPTSEEEEEVIELFCEGLIGGYGFRLDIDYSDDFTDYSRCEEFHYLTINSKHNNDDSIEYVVSPEMIDLYNELREEFYPWL